MKFCLVLLTTLALYSQGSAQIRSIDIQNSLKSLNDQLKNLTTDESGSYYRLRTINNRALEFSNGNGKKFIIDPTLASLGISNVFNFGVLYLKCDNTSSCIQSITESGISYRNKIIIQLNRPTNDTSLENEFNTYFSLINNFEPKGVFVADNNPDITSQKRIALVISNSDYSGSVSDLTGPKLDHKIMASTLKSLGFRVLSYKDLKKEKFDEAVNSFLTELVNYDIGLFYYTGHGTSNTNGVNFLIPTDFDLDLVLSQSEALEKITSGCIELKGIWSRMEETNENTNLVIIDACRDLLQYEIKSIESLGFSSGFTPPITAPKGTIICYSTSPNTKSYGSRLDKDTPSVFTKHLSNYLSEKEPFALLMYKVKAKVFYETNKRQLPWYLDSTLEAFYFNY